MLRDHSNYVTRVEFSPDSRYVLTGSWDQTARLWEAETGKPVALMRGHTALIHDARFSPDGRLIATAGDTTVRIWNGMTGQPVTVLNVFTAGLDSMGGQRAVEASIFSPDGHSLLVSTSDDTTRIYSWEKFAPLDDLLALGRTRVTRQFTTDEKRKYLHEVIDDKALPNR